MKSIPFLAIPFTCYLMAAGFVGKFVLAQCGFAIPGAISPADATGLVDVACIAAVLGVISHLVLYRFRPDEIDHRGFLRFGIPVMAVVACMSSLTCFGGRITGLSKAELDAHIQTAFRLTGFAPAVFFWIDSRRCRLSSVRNQFRPANQISQLMSIGDFDAAKRIGEQHLKRKWEFATCVNLAHVYARSGELERARELLEELERKPCVPKYCTQEVFTQVLNALKASIEETTRHDSGNEFTSVPECFSVRVERPKAMFKMSLPQQFTKTVLPTNHRIYSACRTMLEVLVHQLIHEGGLRIR